MQQLSGEKARWTCLAKRNSSFSRVGERESVAEIAEILSHSPRTIGTISTISNRSSRLNCELAIIAMRAGLRALIVRVIRSGDSAYLREI
jgi:hypothetical protein